MPTVEALRLAEEQGIDLIEVSPQAQPPVCRLMEFGKFQYQQSRQTKNKTKRVDIKGIRLSLKIGQHDIETKQKQVAKFLDQGHKVKIDLRLRGREKAFRGKGVEVVKQFIDTLQCEYKLDKPIETQMGTISTIIAKK
jgi:translation initiation factor IF-3